MKKQWMQILPLVLFAIGIAMAGCSGGSSSSDEPAPKGQRPDTVVGDPNDPNIKAPEERFQKPTSGGGGNSATDGG